MHIAKTHVITLLFDLFQGVQLIYNNANFYFPQIYFVHRQHGVCHL